MRDPSLELLYNFSLDCLACFYNDGGGEERDGSQGEVGDDGRGNGGEGGPGVRDAADMRNSWDRA